VFHERRNTSEGAKRALEYYNQAVTVDPSFAAAFANMTDAYSNLASAGVIDRPAALAKAKAAALKAVQLDGTLAEGHGALAVMKVQEWDWPGAEIEFRRAIKLNPNLSGVHSDYAIYLTITGRFDEALASNRRAQELDPLGIAYKAHEGRILVAARRYDAAIRVLLAALEMKPDEPSVHLGLARRTGGSRCTPKRFGNTAKFSSYTAMHRLPGSTSRALTPCPETERKRSEF
jgi:Tfp pilus assembly protein PilF